MCLCAGAVFVENRYRLGLAPTHWRLKPQPAGGLLRPTMHLDGNVLVTSGVAGGESSQWVGRAVVLAFCSFTANHTNYAI
ncbi:hypothetical protein INR49_014338 [Caranx melampygus]|nr:hypothetical protein INR49_014338 [Caranx melampygus]